MLPNRTAPILFGFILSGLMSLLVSGISTYRIIGPDAPFIAPWASAWLAAWMVAFPVVLMIAPVARKLVALLVDQS